MYKHFIPTLSPERFGRRFKDEFCLCIGLYGVILELCFWSVAPFAWNILIQNKVKGFYCGLKHYLKKEERWIVHADVLGFISTVVEERRTLIEQQ